MAFKIVDTIALPNETLFYEEGFRTIVETCLPQLSWYGITRDDIHPDHLQQYQANFYGYLVEINILPEYHWSYMRVNNMDHPREFAAELRDPLNHPYYPKLIRPSHELIGQLRAFYINRRK